MDPCCYTPPPTFTVDKGGGLTTWMWECGSLKRMLQTGWSIYVYSYIHLLGFPGLQTKLSVCKQSGEGGESVVTPALEGVKHSCSRPKNVFIKYASSRGSTIPSLSFPLSLLLPLPPYPPWMWGEGFQCGFYLT